jgi:hypothetical protein
MASSSERNPTLCTPTHPDQNPASQALSPLKLLQLGINPKEQWVNKLLARTRTEEAKAIWLAIYSAYDPQVLEQEFNNAIVAQSAFVNQCRADPENRVHLERYLARFPSIPGEVGLEDLSRLNLALAAAGSGGLPAVPPTQSPDREVLPRTMPLAEGMEVYVDGKVGAVVVTPDREISPQTSKVLVQSRGMNPYEVEVTRCSVIQDGAYPHPSVFRAQDEVRIAQLRLHQKGRNLPKFHNLSLPKVPVLPSEWEEEDKVSWFSEVVKFRHRFISAGPKKHGAREPRKSTLTATPSRR